VVKDKDIKVVAQNSDLKYSRQIKQINQKEVLEVIKKYSNTGK